MGAISRAGLPRRYTLEHLPQSFCKMLIALITIYPAITAFVVAMAGMMFPAISVRSEDVLLDNECLTSRAETDL